MTERQTYSLMDIHELNDQVSKVKNVTNLYLAID